MKRLLPLLAALLAAALAAGCARAAQQPAEVQIFRYADNQPDDYPTTQAAYRFAELVQERTGGRIEIRVYGDAELGDEVSVIQQVQLGMVDFARASISTLSGICEELNVLQMPYLYTDSDQMWRVLDGAIGAKFLGDLTDQELVGLSWFDAGARSFYMSGGPITCPADLKGKRIRVQESQLMMDLVSALGAEPVTMVYSEVYAGLQSGEIDGAENNWPSYESMNHCAVAKYFVLDEHMRVPEMQLMSKATMDRLSEQDQAVIRQAALESAQYERELWVQREAKSEQTVRAAGAQVTELSETERAAFQAATQELYDRYCSQYTEIIRAIRAA